jgi:uncharacterized protein YbjT (DUF2867 family)
VNVAIAGAHGQIALRLARLLAAEGDRVIGLIRNPDHAAEVSRAGAVPVRCDLERASVEEIATAIQGADAVVFAAGAGPGSGAERKLTMDRDGAIKLLRAATTAGAARYLMISGAGVENPPGGDEVFAVYLRAKAQADAALQASDREWTILRPGGLADDAGTGRVRIDSAPFSGPVSRDDVASVLARLLTDSRSVGRVLYLSSGAQSIEQALDEVLGSPRLLPSVIVCYRLLSKETHRDEASNYGSGHGRYGRSHRPGSGGANAARCYCSWIAFRKRFGGCPRRSAGASGSDGWRYRAERHRLRGRTGEGDPRDCADPE